LATASPKRSRSTAPAALTRLVERFDHSVFDLPEERAVIRLTTAGGPEWDVTVERKTARIAPARGNPDATVDADLATWESIGDDVAGGMEAFRRGRLHVRRNLHLGVGFLAATGPDTPGRLRFDRVRTAAGSFSILEAGSGPPVLMLHGLGGTKASFLPTVAALAPDFRAIAVDALGFGDSDKPLGASYGPQFQADAVAALLDAMEIDRAHLLGHSMGGRIALEVGFEHHRRIERLVLMTPAMAWLRERRWAPYLKLVRPELGLLQIAPRPVVDRIVRRLIPGADSPAAAAGIDEFIRAYTTARGRAAFYAAARHIYLDEPHGDDGFWTRLRELAPDAMFLWGRKDMLVPTAFMKHVERELPAAHHVELDCGHIPQIERPRQAHAAIASFLQKGRPARRASARPASRRATRARTG
jgi:pimeloyl-ACP methyl ester carboxylesterase